MNEPTRILQMVDRLAKTHTEYHADAYLFVLTTISHLMQSLATSRHVTGRELLAGLRSYGLEQFGPLTKTVFEFWRVRTTQDFGHIVFQLVDIGLLGKTEDDSLKDFENIYDFSHAFEQSYRYVE